MYNIKQEDWLLVNTLFKLTFSKYRIFSATVFNLIQCTLIYGIQFNSIQFVKIDSHSLESSEEEFNKNIHTMLLSAKYRNLTGSVTNRSNMRDHF